MVQNIKIRKMVYFDIPQIIKILKKELNFKVSVNNEVWSKEQLERWVKSKSDVLLIAEQNKKIIGFVMFACHGPTKKVMLENAWVIPEFRGKRVIEKLVKHGLKLLKDKGFIYICSLVKIDNISSIKFLEKLSFIKGFSFSWLYRRI